MEISRECIERKFRKFNTMIFEGKLPEIACRTSKAKGFLGQLRYRKKMSFWGGAEYMDFELVVSNRREMDEELLEDTVIHEMIHYYILHNRLKDTSSHGRIFRQMMEGINSRFGRNITISHKTGQSGIEEDLTIRKHYFCLSRLKDGREGITVAAHTRLYAIWKDMERCGDVVSYGWYASTDPYFNRFRRCLTLKIYLTEKEQLQSHMANAVELEMAEGSVRIKK